MNLASIKRSISEMPYKEVLGIVLSIRNNRCKRKVQAPREVGKSIDLAAMLSRLSKEQKLKLLEELEE